MPRSYEEIIQEILQDPSQMQGTMKGGTPIPNDDMIYNPQKYDTMYSPNSYNLMMDPSDILDKPSKRERGKPMDDTQTDEQKTRTNLERLEDQYKHPKTPMIDPRFTPPLPSVGASPMQRLYGQMPQTMMQPQGNMPELQDNPNRGSYGTGMNMQQLMDFYTQGGTDI